MVQRGFSMAFWLVFWLAGGLQHWIGQRFTTAGQFVLVGVLASAVVGLDTYRTMAYQAFTLLAALLALATVASLPFRARFEARRLLPRYATVGQPLAYRVLVRSRSAQAERALVLREQVADPRPSFEEFRGRGCRARSSTTGGTAVWATRAGSGSPPTTAAPSRMLRRCRPFRLAARPRSAARSSRAAAARSGSPGSPSPAPIRSG